MLQELLSECQAKGINLSVVNGRQLTRILHPIFPHSTGKRSYS